MSRWVDPAAWKARWWLPLAALAAAAGFWLEPPGAGRPPRADTALVAPSTPFPSCGELENGYARAACNSG